MSYHRAFVSGVWNQVIQKRGGLRKIVITEAVLTAKLPLEYLVSVSSQFLEESRRVPAASKTRPPVVTPRVKLWLEAQGESVFCRGLADMLNAVDRTQSIKAAATDVGRSYRFVWARIKEAEQALGAKLVEAHIGGSGTRRSALTPLAKDLLQEFEQLRAAVFQLVDKDFARRLQQTLKKHRKTS